MTKLRNVFICRLFPSRTSKKALGSDAQHHKRQDKGNRSTNGAAPGVSDPSCWNGVTELPGNAVSARSGKGSDPRGVKGPSWVALGGGVCRGFVPYPWRFLWCFCEALLGYS